MSFRRYIQQIVPLQATKESLALQEQLLEETRELKEALLANKTVVNETSSDTLNEQIDEILTLIKNKDITQAVERSRELDEILQAINKGKNTDYQELKTVEKLDELLEAQSKLKVADPEPHKEEEEKEKEKSPFEIIPTNRSNFKRVMDLMAEELQSSLRHLNKDKTEKIITGVNKDAKKSGTGVQIKKLNPSPEKDLTTGTPNLLKELKETILAPIGPYVIAARELKSLLPKFKRKPKPDKRDFRQEEEEEKVKKELKKKETDLEKELARSAANDPSNINLTKSPDSSTNIPVDEAQAYQMGKLLEITTSIKDKMSEGENRVDPEEYSSFESEALSVMYDISQNVKVKDPDELSDLAPEDTKEREEDLEEDKKESENTKQSEDKKRSEKSTNRSEEEKRVDPEEEKRVDPDELSSFEATALSTLDDISQKVNVKDPKEREEDLEEDKKRSEKSTDVMVKELKKSRKGQMSILAVVLLAAVALGTLGTIFKEEIGTFSRELSLQLRTSFDNLMVKIGVSKEDVDEETGVSYIRSLQNRIRSWAYALNPENAKTRTEDDILNKEEGIPTSNIVLDKEIDRIVQGKELLSGNFRPGLTETIRVESDDGSIKFVPSEEVDSRSWIDRSPLGVGKRNWKAVQEPGEHNWFQMNLRDVAHQRHYEEAGYSKDASYHERYRLKTYLDLVDKVQERIDRYMKSGLEPIEANIRQEIQEGSEGRFNERLVDELLESLDLGRLEEANYFSSVAATRTASVYPYVKEGDKDDQLRFGTDTKLIPNDQARIISYIENQVRKYKKDRKNRVLLKNVQETADQYGLEIDFESLTDEELEGVLVSLMSRDFEMFSTPSIDVPDLNARELVAMEGQKLSKEQLDTAKKMDAFFRDKGFSKEESQALISVAAGESSLDPYNTNLSSGATGLYQWLGPRLTEFRKFKRAHPEFDEVKAQLEFLMHELNTTEQENLKKAGFGKDLKAPELAAGAQSFLQRSLYHGPGNTDARQLFGLSSHNKYAEALSSAIPDFDPTIYQDLSEGKYLRGTKSSYLAAGGIDKKYSALAFLQNRTSSPAWYAEWRSAYTDEERKDALIEARRRGYAVADKSFVHQELAVATGTTDQLVYPKPAIVPDPFDLATPGNPLVADNSAEKKESARASTNEPFAYKDVETERPKEEKKESVQNNHSSSTVIVNTTIKQPNQPSIFGK